MGVIGTIIVGLVVGAIARFVMPGEQRLGWIGSVLGAVVLLFAVQKVRGGSGTK